MLDKGMVTYYQYLDHLYAVRSLTFLKVNLFSRHGKKVFIPFQTKPPLDCYSQFSKGYEDYLQCPLQVQAISK